MSPRGSTSDLLQGTLDLLILQTLREGAEHGWAISQQIQERSRGVLEVNQGSLYPALHRLELRGVLESEWSTSDNNRRAKFYRLTDSGRAALAAETASWRRYVGAVELLLEPSS
jgi:PadR family transcriptional regulator, regulatory protein PadR